MINILPPELKTQLTYSKRNVVLRRYCLLLLLIILAIGGTLVISHRYVSDQISAYEQVLAETKNETSSYQELEQNVTGLNDKLGTTRTLLNGRTRFSLLLMDLAEVLPTGSYINGITLTGETDQPLQLVISTDSSNQAVVVRNALLQSPRIASADIQSITPSTVEDIVNVSLVIAFNEEASE